MSDATDAVQSALNEHLDGMVVGFVAVIEEIDDDGASTLRILHTEMTAWHALGMLEYAKDEVHLPLVGDEAGDDLVD